MKERGYKLFLENFIEASVIYAEAVGIGTGNPGVFQGYLYPNPSLPVPAAMGTGFDGWGTGFQFTHTCTIGTTGFDRF